MAASIDFQTFLLSLASSGMMHLGRVPDPTGRAPQVDLTLARQTIDILLLLRDKTAGNLDAGERVLLDRLISDLQMAFADESRKAAS
jgi:hypothetical protein